MFPRNVEILAKVEGGISCVKSPSSDFYAVLTANSVVIVDVRDRSFPIVAILETESTNRNHWIAWIQETRIIFGTFSGNIAVAAFENENFAGLAVEKELKCVITSVFHVSESRIGLCLVGPKLISFDCAGRSEELLNLETRLGIVKNVCWVSRELIGFEANGVWFVYDRRLNAPRAVTSVCGLVAGCGRLFSYTVDGVVSKYNTASRMWDEVFRTGEVMSEIGVAGSERLVGVGGNGTVVVYDFTLEKLWMKKFDGVGDSVMTSFFDEKGRRFVILDSTGKLKSIVFFSVCPPYLLTAAGLIKIDSGETLAEVPDLRNSPTKGVKSLPLDMFPLCGAVPDPDGRCCVTGRQGIAIVTSQSLFFDPTPVVRFAVLMTDKVCAIDSDGIMSIYNLDLLNLGRMRLQQIPESVHGYGTRMVMTVKRQISVFEFDGTKHKANFNIGDVGIHVKSFHAESDIVRGFVGWNDTVVVECDNGKLYSFPENVVLCDSCRVSWANTEPNALLVMRDDGVTAFGDGKQTHCRDIHSMWSWGANVYEMSTDLIFKKTNFASRFVPLGTPENSELAEKLTKMIDEPNFKEELEQMTMDYADAALALKQMEVEVAPRILDAMTVESVQALGAAGLDFTPYFEHVKPSTQSRILICILPSLFEGLVNEHRELIQSKEYRFRSFVIKQALIQNSFTRALMFARTSKTDFGSIVVAEFADKSLRECMCAIKQDVDSWPSGDPLDRLKDLGNAFQVAVWSLACFLLLKDEDRVTAILNEEPVALMACMTLTREDREGCASLFLRSLSLGF